MFKVCDLENYMRLMDGGMCVCVSVINAIFP